MIKNFFKKYTKIRGKISSLMNKEFDSDPVYGNSDKYIKGKTKLFGDKLDAYF